MRERIEQLEDALDAILQGIQDALQAGEILSDDLQLAAAQEINALTAEIDQLYTQARSSASRGSSTATTSRARSTTGNAIKQCKESFGYDEKTGERIVRFSKLIILTQMGLCIATREFPKLYLICLKLVLCPLGQTGRISGELGGKERFPA